MNFKKWWVLTACLCLCFMLISLLLPVPAFAYTYYNNDGFLTVECDNYDFQYDFSLVYDVSSPSTTSSVDIPSGYSLVGFNVFRDSNTQNTLFYIYFPADTPYTLVDNGSSVTLRGTSNFDIYIVTNRLTSSGSQSFLAFQHSNNYNWGSSSRYVAFTPVLDSNGNILRPESTISFDLNVAISDNFLYFNSAVNSGDGGLVTYYIFPSSANIPTGSISPVASGSVAELDSNALQRLSSKGFNLLINQWANLAGYDITNPFPPRIVSLSASSYRFSGGFNPSSFNLPYEKIGTSPLYPSTGITSTNHLNMVDIANLSGGVYAYSSLKLVAVVTLENRDFVASYDFTPSQILNGAPVPPTDLQGSAPFPSPQLTDPDLQDLAEYLKNLGSTFNDNQIRNDQNLIAMLGAMPWSNFIGTGFVNALPNLSFTLDSLFDSLFDKFTAPTEAQIDEMYAEVQAERSDLRSKLAFVDDVKTEYYFAISTITADNNSVPPDFEFSLPSIWSGGQTIRVKLISYEIATPEIMSNIKQVVTVFLSLALLLHIWRTLPSTVGNMPRGDD